MDKQKGLQWIYKHAENADTQNRKKNNVNRETLVLKAIINQTRSIGNGQAQGSRLCTGQGCTRRFSPAGQNQHQQEEES